MTPGRSDALAYVSRAEIHRSASLERVAALMASLERSGAEVRLDPEGGLLHFAFPCRYERWILLGGLAELLARYADVATWDRTFEERWQGDEVESP